MAIQNDSSPTQPLVEYEVPPISERRRAELWIIAIVLSAPLLLALGAGFLAATMSDWSSLAQAVLFTAFFLVLARNAWRALGTHRNPLTGEDPQAEALETRAMRETLERYDRVIAEAQAGAAGESEPASHSEERGEVARRMRERGDTE